MHSRIFEILEKGQEPTLNQWTFEDTTYLEAYGIDYVSEMDEEEIDDSIDWLVKSSDGFIVYDKETKSIKFDKKKLMEIDYNAFIKFAKELSQVTIDEFSDTAKDYANSVEYKKTKLDESYGDRWGFYFYNEDLGLLPENEFLRKLKDGEIYYLGNVLDHHM